MTRYYVFAITLCLHLRPLSKKEPLEFGCPPFRQCMGINAICEFGMRDEDVTRITRRAAYALRHTLINTLRWKANLMLGRTLRVLPISLKARWQE